MCVVFKTLRAKNHPGRSFCAPPPRDPTYPSLHRQHKPDIDHLSTGRHPPPSPHTLLTPPSTETPSTTQDQASVREGLAIDTKCGTKCRNGAPQTHKESSTQASQPSSQAYSVVNFWHAMQDQRQLFLRETLWLDGKNLPGVKATKRTIPLASKMFKIAQYVPTIIPFVYVNTVYIV